MTRLSIEPSRYQLSHSEATEVAHKTIAKIQSLRLGTNPIHFFLLYEWLTKTDSYFSEQIDITLSLKSYNDDSASQLFHEAIEIILNQKLPTEDLSNLINDLLLNMNSWLSDSNIYQDNLEEHIDRLASINLPTQAINILKENILPILKKQKSQTEHLKITVDNAQQEVQHLKYELEKTTKISLTDELTNIPNRRGFNHKIQEMIQEAQDNQSSFALLVIDIDHFKKINDTYGHLLGDSILRFLAKFLQHETKGKDLVARIGVEEFVIAMANTNYDSSLRVAEQIRFNLNKKTLNIKSQARPIKVSVSIGVSTYQMGETLETLFGRADNALYKAKNSGRNKVCGET